MNSCDRQTGFTYLSALFLIAGVGAALGAIGELWSHARQREKEAELVWVGNQFRQAIGSYYERSPGIVKRYPEKLEDLLEDHRFLVLHRHLRKIYSNPITGKTEWRLIPAPNGGVMGVASLSGLQTGRNLHKLTSYSEVSFVFGFVYEPQKPSTTSSKH